jgi:hypothetical protein
MPFPYVQPLVIKHRFSSSLRDCIRRAGFCLPEKRCAVKCASLPLARTASTPRQPQVSQQTRQRAE